MLENNLNVNILGSNCSYDHGTIQGEGWNTLISGLKNTGANLFFNDTSLKNYDLIISFDHYKWMENIFNTVHVPISKRILIIQEPEVVLPRMYKPFTLSLYGAIFAGSIDWAERLGVKSYKYPLDTSSSASLNISERNIDTAMIQSNKFSCIKGEQYSLRRAILKLAKEQNYTIELYGTGWNKGYLADFITVSKYLRVILGDIKINNVTLPYKYLGSNYPNYMGKIQSKIELLGNVKKNIVIENSSTYVSEKLFDSLRSGSIPFYVGANLSKYGIPNSVAVLCEANPESILDRLASITNEELSEIQKEGLHFLKSKEIGNWSAPVQVNKLLQCINEVK
jgi:hypothetical protein